MQIIGQKRRAEQRQRPVTLAMNQDLYALIFVKATVGSADMRCPPRPLSHHPVNTAAGLPARKSIN